MTRIKSKPESLSDRLVQCNSLDKLKELYETFPRAELKAASGKIPSPIKIQLSTWIQGLQDPEAEYDVLRSGKWITGCKLVDMPDLPRLRHWIFEKDGQRFPCYSGEDFMESEDTEDF